jgi:hypothetical protein
MDKDLKNSVLDQNLSFFLFLKIQFLDKIVRDFFLLLFKFLSIKKTNSIYFFNPILRKDNFAHNCQKFCLIKFFRRL